MPQNPWMVSLHGGHSSEFCEHAQSTLDEMIEAAIAAGYHTFGVSEHAPRYEERFIYPSEREKGYTLERIHSEWTAYTSAVFSAADRYADRITVMRGFEAEVIPAASYADKMLGLRAEHRFDFMVGSVHYVDERSIDGEKADFDALVADLGLEQLSVRYYQAVAEMVPSLRPDVVGHLDLVRRNAAPDAVLDSPPIRAAAERALEAIREQGAVLDLNLAGIRKNLGGPYPAPWLIERALAMGIGFCFGDDSHNTGQVAHPIDQGRAYLLANGVHEITYLTRRDGAVVRESAPLD